MISSLKSHILQLQAFALRFFHTRIALANDYTILTPKFFYIICLNSIAFAIISNHFGFGEFNDLQKRFFSAIAFNFGATYAILYISAFISKIVANIVLNALFIISFAIGAVNIFLLINFYSVINYAAVEILLASNAREAKEFMSMYMNAKTIYALGAFSIFSVLFCAKLPYLLLQYVLKIYPKLAKFTLSKQITIRFTPKFAIGIICIALVANYSHKKDLAGLGKKSEIIRVADAVNYHHKLNKELIKDYRNFNSYLTAMVESKLANTQIGGGLS